MIMEILMPQMVIVTLSKKYVEGIVRNNLFLPTKMDGAKI